MGQHNENPIIKSYSEEAQSNLATGSDYNIDVANYNVCNIQLTGSGAINIGFTTDNHQQNANSAVSVTVFLTNGGLRTITWKAGPYASASSNVKFAGGTPPTLTASGVDVLTFATPNGGTDWYGFTGGIAFA